MYVLSFLATAQRSPGHDVADALLADIHVIRSLMRRPCLNECCSRDPIVMAYQTAGGWDRQSIPCLLMVGQGTFLYPTPSPPRP